MRAKQLFFFLIYFFIVCATYASTTPSPESSELLHLDWFDTSISLQQNFYAFANGGWQRQTLIPRDYPTWNAFSIVNEKTLNQLHELLINAANDRHSQPGSIERKIGDFYYSGMDEKTINRVGIKPLRPILNKIEAMQDVSEVPAMISFLHQYGFNILFEFGSMADFKNSQQMIAALAQDGLVLPDRDYYLKKDKKSIAVQQAYVKHIQKMLMLLGEKPAQAHHDAHAIMQFETQLATATIPRVNLRDPYATYNKVTIQNLIQEYPNYHWPLFFKTIGLEHLNEVNIVTPAYFKALNQQLNTKPLALWKAYFRWHILNDLAPYLSEPFVNEQFEMKKMLTGVENILPRWKRVVAAESEALDFAVGKAYVERYFKEETKQKILEIIKNIKYVFQQELQTLPWMEEGTRKAALRKLSAMTARVGYPNKWLDYSNFKVDRGPYVLNIIRANQYLQQRDFNKIGKPIDKEEWAMTPQTVNAYYDPTMNNINLTAAILQSPFYDDDAPTALNYGAIGFIIGHEMTHAFDDSGAQFDEKGNLNNWWTKKDLEQFKMATACIVKQFSSYKVTPNLFLNGALVVGEATADLGGLTLAYKAFQLLPDNQKGPIIAHYTPAQQFFIGAAHIWANVIRPAYAIQLATTDPHPLAAYRVNGTFANMPEFQQTFEIPNGKAMVNKKRCVIW